MAELAEGTIVLRDIAAENGREGSTGVELSIAGQRVSGCQIIPLTLRIGAAGIKVDGIGMVGTAEAYRLRGLSRRVMTAAIEHMEQGDAALSMLYGITDFYPKFGYVASGPESTLSFPPLGDETPLPSGWCTRPFRAPDLPAVRLLYENATAGRVGTAMRQEKEYPWTALLDSLQGDESSDCTVIVRPDGAIAGYVWRGERLEFVRMHTKHNPDALVLAEAVARGGTAADVAVQICRRWGATEAARRGRAVDRVLLFMSPEGPVTDAARYVTSTFQQEFEPDGGWMTRLLSTERFLRALEPELSRRLKDARIPFDGRIRLVTEMGGVTLDCKDGVRVVDAEESVTVPLPQSALVRLALGAYRPEDLLHRLDASLPEEVQRLMVALFPKREPHLYLADRF